jgi:hypothetical protein
MPPSPATARWEGRTGGKGFQGSQLVRGPPGGPETRNPEARVCKNSAETRNPRLAEKHRETQKPKVWSQAKILSFLLAGEIFGVSGASELCVMDAWEFRGVLHEQRCKRRVVTAESDSIHHILRTMA